MESEVFLIPVIVISIFNSVHFINYSNTDPCKSKPNYNKTEKNKQPYPESVTIILNYLGGSEQEAEINEIK